MSEFLAMGGYAWYVWMSYGVVALAILVEITEVRTRRRRALAELRMSLGASAHSPSATGAKGNR